MKKNCIYYIKKIIYPLINFFKMLLLYLFKGITFFFPDKKNIKNTKTENIPHKRQEETTYFNEEIILPDEENAKSTPILNLEEKKINNIFTLIDIEEMVNLVLKKEFELDIDKLTNTEKKEVQEFKKHIFPILIHNIEYKNIKTKDELETDTKKVIKEEGTKKPFSIKNNSRTKIEYDALFPLNLVKKETIEINTPKKSPTTEIFNEETKKNLPSPPPVKIKNPEINLNKEVTTRITASTFIVATIAKEILEDSKDTIKIEKPFQEEKQRKRIEELNDLTIESSLEFMTILNKEDLTKEEIVQLEEKITEKKRKQEEQEEKMQEIERKVDKEIIEPYKEVFFFELSINELEKENHIENKKEDLEEKNYDYLKEQIDKMLYEIEMFIINNEGKIKKEKLDKLKKEKEKLENLKEKIEQEKKQDIEKDALLFSSPVKKEEKDGLMEALNKLQQDHQEDLNKESLNKIEDLENIDKKKRELIEKKLIKKKLKKAVFAANIASLPFIKNRFFFAFSLGLLVKYNLHFLNNIIERTTKNIEKMDLDSISNGQSAIEQAIYTNYDNIQLLQMLNKKALVRHPDLKIDGEYQYFCNHLQTKLSKNYTKLNKKYGNLEKFHKKRKRNIKILKRTEKK